MHLFFLMNFIFKLLRIKRLFDLIIAQLYRWEGWSKTLGVKEKKQNFISGCPHIPRMPGLKSSSVSYKEWSCPTPMSFSTSLLCIQLWPFHWASTLISTCIWIVCFSGLPTSSCSVGMLWSFYNLLPLAGEWSHLLRSGPAGQNWTMSSVP